MDHRDERHGQEQSQTHAGTGGAPSLRPLDSASLKPLSPLRAMPQQSYPVPAYQPSSTPPAMASSQPAPTQGSPAPMLQMKPLTGQPIAQQRTPTPAYPTPNRSSAMQPQPEAAPKQPSYPVPAYQPNGMPPMQPSAAQQSTPAPAYPPASQLAHVQPQQEAAPQQRYPVPAYQPNAMPPMPPLTERQAAPQGAPVPAYQPASRPTSVQPQQTTAHQSAPVPAYQPNAMPPMPPLTERQAQPQNPTPNDKTMPWLPSNIEPDTTDMQTLQQPPLRHTWRQTIPQHTAQGMPPQASLTDVPSGKPHTAAPNSVTIAHRIRPSQTMPESDANTPPARVADIGGVRRRRSAAHNSPDSLQPEAITSASADYTQPTPQAAMPSVLAADMDAFQTDTQPSSGVEATLDTATAAQALPSNHSETIPPSPQTATWLAIDDDADAADVDTARYKAVSQTKLAEPVPVPTHATYTPKKKRKPLRTLLRIILLLLALAAVSIAALYFTGHLGKVADALLPADGQIPSIFGQASTADPSAGAITPATKIIAPVLREIAVEPATATAPAELAFTLETNTATTSVRLLTEDGATIHTTAFATPKGDSLLWQVTASLDEPYTGSVRVFLRDEAGKWSVGELTSDIDIR